jgi:hypothetical protein
LKLWDAISGRNTLVNYGPLDGWSRSQSLTWVAGGAFVCVPMRLRIAVFHVHTGRLVKQLR